MGLGTQRIAWDEEFCEARVPVEAALDTHARIASSGMMPIEGITKPETGEHAAI
jgi:hypothetical protein